MILNGQDVNLRAGPEDIDLFTYYYYHKCQMKTFYFDCCSLIELYRPCATHIAIFFNCKETLEHLIAAQVILLINHLFIYLFYYVFIYLFMNIKYYSVNDVVLCGLVK